MTVTLSVERYDKMQAEILSLKERQRAGEEGLIYLGNSYFMGQNYKRLFLPSEVVDQLNMELAEKVKYLEAEVLPKIAKKRVGWWWKVLPKQEGEQE